MGRLFDLSTGKQIATISKEQAAFLTSCLQEEDLTDVDYYIDRTTLDYLKAEAAEEDPAQAAQELVSILESAVGESESIDIAYDDVDAEAPFYVSGCVIDGKEQTPISLLKIEAWDRDIVLHDYLGWTFTDEKGQFTIRYKESDFKDAFESVPDILIKIKKWQDNRFSTIEELKFKKKATGKDDFGNIEV